VEPGEACDDGNNDPSDGCDQCTVVAQTTAFLMSDIDLRDPHTFAEVIIFGCQDITNTVLGQDGVNPQFENAIQNDADGDGLLDLSLVVAFDPLAQGNGASGQLTLTEADCTDPIGSTSCTATPGAPSTTFTYTSQTSGVC